MKTQSKKQEATPRPWQIKNEHDFTIIGNIDGPDGGHNDFHYDTICEINTDGVDYDANAELIVRAVNAHDDVVESLKTALIICDLFNEQAEGRVSNAFMVSWKKIESALAKAEGKSK